MQEKYGTKSRSAEIRNDHHFEEDDGEDSESLSTSEEEDDEGILASELLDGQIQSTLEAIRNKDPCVYDEQTKFYTGLDEETQKDLDTSTKSKEKPMYLSDYHRKNLLDGVITDDAFDIQPTYTQQQDILKNEIVQQMHAVDNDGDNSGVGQSDSHESADEFLVKKSVTLQEDIGPVQNKQRHKVVDVEAAEKDPEAYLSNFMSARAWVPSDSSRFQPFESDDEEEERKAELFEEAYNLRFEDPNASNEKLLSHARDAAAKYSVRKEDTNRRKRAREAERNKKEIAKQTREEEKARLRKLKVIEAEEKIRQIKEAAGLRGESLKQEEWSAFLEEGWDDARWEREMSARFGDSYYAINESEINDMGEVKEKGKIKKPKWKDDIGIDDLVPQFDADENTIPQFELTEDEAEVNEAAFADAVHENPEDGDSNGEPARTMKAKKKRDKAQQNKAERRERQNIEHLIDHQLDVDDKLTRLRAGQFRYRETSPLAYGLTPQDILMASDSQLNQYAGLKKMATFRDADKKRKDKKHLGKKARLRRWRKDTFGNEQGPQKTLAEVLAGQDPLSREPAQKPARKVHGKEGDKRIKSEKSKMPESGRGT